jgi:hypothetical protein
MVAVITKKLPAIAGNYHKIDLKIKRRLALNPPNQEVIVVTNLLFYHCFWRFFL